LFAEVIKVMMAAGVATRWQRSSEHVAGSGKKN
jgi:hypothetical protein